MLCDLYQISCLHASKKCEECDYKQHRKLANKIKKANVAYYDNDDPIMSDYEYDALTQQLKDIELRHPELATNDSPTQYVGGTASKSSFAKVEHVVPMLSLQDVFNESDVANFLRSMPCDEFTVEEKIDGLSMSVTYQNGKLIRAETRGDGRIGEDITENAKHIIGIPKRIKSNGITLLEVRCEVYLPIQCFLELNQEKEREGQKLFANPRNAAAGLLRTKDVDVVKDARLHAFAFNVQRYETESGIYDPRFSSQARSLETLSALGFEPVRFFESSKKQVIEYIKQIGEHRNNLQYWIDGAVIKVDNISARTKLGETAKYPKWAIAYKYPPEEKETRINNIILQTGRTGRVTPVALFEPVLLAGTKVERASLHNPQIITSLKVNVGDTIVVRKAAEIVPEVVRVVRKASETYYDVLSHVCPSCGGKLTADEDGNGAFCINENCPAKNTTKFVFWASRDCMNIDGFGPAIVERFIELGWLNSIPDIYMLHTHKEEMRMLDGFGKKSADKLLSAIEKSKKNDIDRLIKAIGIHNVGRHIGKELAKTYPNMQAIESASEEELAKLDGVGPISAQAIYGFFHEAANLTWLHQLYGDNGCGVNGQSHLYGSINEIADGLLNGKTFAVTGTLPALKREEAIQLIEKHGGKVSSSISKKTNFLLYGENAGSKLEKAKTLGIKTLTEDDLIRMLQR